MQGFGASFLRASRRTLPGKKHERRPDPALKTVDNAPSSGPGKLDMGMVDRNLNLQPCYEQIFYTAFSA